MRGLTCASGLALVLAGSLTAGCTASPDRAAAVHRPHTAAVHRPHTAAVTAGWRVVTYHGVHVNVPAAWPVVDGMHAPLCGGPFVKAPEVLVGPDDNPPVPCPYIPAKDIPARDGVWLLSGARPPGARPVAVSRHVTVLRTPYGPDSHVIDLWYRHVVIEIGIGPDPRIARRIVGSIAYARGLPDTRDSGDCAQAAPAKMPSPKRLARRLVIEQGDITLNPPRPSDRPVMAATAAWQQAQITSPFDRYQLLLVRYSAKYPAAPGADGTYVPEDRNVLAWVIYSQPRTPISGCGLWSLTSFNALTGQGISSDAWSPGP